MGVLLKAMRTLDKWQKQNSRMHRLHSRWLDYKSIGAGIFLFLLKDEL
jgi:hypothetical protein